MDEFLQELSNYLYLSKKITEKEGTQINVGEHFTVRFTLTNTAPPVTTVDQRLIRFKRPYLQVVLTQYAQPCMPDGTPVGGLGNNFPDNSLNPGDSTSMEFKMIATADIPGREDYLLQEIIADAYVHAHLDVDEYFKVMRVFKIKTEIHPKLIGPFPIP
jgi:hypothetical protein